VKHVHYRDDKEHSSLGLRGRHEVRSLIFAALQHCVLVPDGYEPTPDRAVPQPSARA